MQLNLQPPERQQLREDGALDIHSIFQTLQGEGPWAGRPATFVRLAGCNLQCPSCDTFYTEGRRLMLLDSLKEHLAIKGARLVVITGGEPFRQDIGKFVDWLYTKSPVCDIQIETNGTFFVSTFKNLLSNVVSTYVIPPISIVCSPKTGTINGQLKPYIHALKYVVEAGKVDPDDGLPTSVLGMTCKVDRPWKGFKGEVFVQPQDDQDLIKNTANIQEAVSVCMKYGYRLSCQIHKFVNLP